MTTTWAEQEKTRIEKFNNWQKEAETIANKIPACITPENRRAGSVEAYNLTSEINQEIEALYSKYFDCIVEFNGRKKWVGVLGIPSEWHLAYYGKNANKFYIMRWTQKQNKSILNSLASAAEENEKY